MSFAKNLRELRKSNKHSQQYLSELLGYRSFTTIQKWEDGSSMPSFKVLLQIADIYSVDVESLVENKIVKQAIPVLGYVQAGVPITAVENIIDYEYLDLDGINQEYFYLEVKGDSMKDLRILPGDRVCIRKQNYLNNNEVGVVLINDEATLKRIKYIEDKIILVSENEEYANMEYNYQDNDIIILGKLIHNKIRY